MGLGSLYITHSTHRFAGIEGNEKSKYRIVGVPFDSTTSYRPGTRFAPDYIRQAASALESNSYFLKDVYLEDAAPYDEGDVVVSIGDAVETLSRVQAVVEEVSGRGIPVLLGGEHTITLGAYRALAHLRPCLVVFDAHLDLRDEYLGLKVGHATFMRRLVEKAPPPRIFYLGSRAFSREELEATRRLNVSIRAAQDFLSLGPVNVASSVISELRECDSIYISVDMDVFDPAFAPGVGNPEPLGLTPLDVLTVINRVVDERLAGADVVEVSPPYDTGGVTSALAAKALLEIILKHFALTGRKRAQIA
ncbi:MAG: agmatinase [Acidilobus sp.]